MTRVNDHKDIDPIETREWIDSLETVLINEGPQRVQYLLDALTLKATEYGYSSDLQKTTPYKNTIPKEQEAQLLGDEEMEQRIRVLIRWNAMAMVVRAQRYDPDLGGHIGTFASSATLYDVGFNHFFRGMDHPCGGDLVFIQGHASPGIYARSFLLGAINESQLVNFRQEVDGKGLSSYPHPWLMKDYWQFPTVSMGLGPLQAIYQARFMKYLEARQLIAPTDRKVWCYCGDGEMDEPESLGAITLASREGLDNLIFVINCNLQRLDGPVRGNGKIVQELEAIFRGAGWNVIKSLWGGLWDPLLKNDKNGLLVKRMDEAVDGDYQNYKAKGGAYTREHFFGKYPELTQMVEHMTDEDVWRLNRAGHDPQKVYAAYHKAFHHQGQPTVILAKTVKGYGLGSAGEALNIAHNTKKLNSKDLKRFRDRFNIPIPEDQIDDVPFYHPGKDSPEVQYMQERRQRLGGQLPRRRTHASEPAIKAPDLTLFKAHLEGHQNREISTTMAFVRMLNALVKDKALGPRVVPIVPDEARTFGMEGLFRQLGIYSSQGQKYVPVDSDQVMFYKEAKNGQILEEGINEAGAFCSWLASGTSYSVYDRTMIPFYIFYSMFGFQRIGDLAWAGGDMRSRGFLLGGTSGRTTINGEGLQHQDGHSHILASTIPNCMSYDPCFAFELAVIIQHGLTQMLEQQKDVFYYITLMNENYSQPPMPKGAQDGIIKGMYLFQPAKKSTECQVQLVGSGAILNEVLKAAEFLEKDFKVGVNVWSATSFNELRKECLAVERWNLLNPEKPPKTSHLEDCLAKTQGPVILASDYMKLYADQLKPFLEKTWVSLGTDGFGRSDTRAQLRRFFEVDRNYIAYSAIKALADEGKMSSKQVLKARETYQIDPNKPDPLSV